jgi:nicotinate-nucleotide pyrophosphorylase (carboxylating)
VQKQAGVVFGFDAAREVFSQVGAGALEPLAAEAQWRDEVPSEIATITGPTRGLLAGERTALNFLCHLSGVATLTARYVAAVAGTRATILDTRKTTPGLRALEKAAVVAGGGTNKRLGLNDAILIKENHVAAAGGLGRAVELAASARPDLAVEVECRNAAEVTVGLASGAHRLLLDNMNYDELRAAVAARDEARSPAELEATGGITLENVADVAATGVDFISIGALTHSAPVLDLSMLLEAE